MRLSSVVVGAALAVAVASGLPALPASAAHPCAQGTDGATYDPSFTSDHDGCSGGPPAARPGDVTVTAADDGATVTVPVGSRLLVALDAGYTGPVWSEVTAGSALHRAYLDVQRPRTSAVFDAARATDGEQVTATGPAAFSVTVVVPPPSTSATPGSSPSPGSTPCTPVRTPAAFDGAVVLTAADDGRTVRVYRGDKVGVFFAGCTGAPDYQPAVATGPLSRYRARGYSPGGASAVFSAAATGTATLTSTTDAPCLHASPACEAPQPWRATVDVVEPCVLTGPARAPAGSDVQLTGRFAPGSTVQVLFRQYGAGAFTVRRTLTADAGGYLGTSYRAVADQRWYATSSQGCDSGPGLTQVAPRIAGPATARRGAVVPITVNGPAGATVQVWFDAPGTSYALRRTGRIGADGVYRTSYTADVDHRYYAVTGPDRRTTAPVLTRVGAAAATAASAGG